MSSELNHTEQAISASQASQTLSLNDFLPYRLSQLQTATSRHIAKVYTGTFNLTRHQWRVLAILGDQNRPLPAKTLSKLGDLDKMQTSRAIAKMAKEQLIVKIANEKDKRSALICLTEHGRATYQQLVPLVLVQEKQLLSALSKTQQQQLDEIIKLLCQKC